MWQEDSELVNRFGVNSQEFAVIISIGETYDAKMRQEFDYCANCMEIAGQSRV